MEWKERGDRTKQVPLELIGSNAITAIRFWKDPAYRHLGEQAGSSCQAKRHNTTNDGTSESSHSTHSMSRRSAGPERACFVVFLRLTGTYTGCTVACTDITQFVIVSPPPSSRLLLSFCLPSISLLAAPFFICGFLFLFLLPIQGLLGIVVK